MVELLIRMMLFHAKRRRKPHIPFFAYLDECQRYLSGDVPITLAEVRKQGVGLILAHQWQSQLAKVDEEILSAVHSATNIKVVFRVKDPREAAELAEMVIPLNLEMPVEVLTKETVVGYGRTFLQNGSVAASFGTSQSSTQSRTQSLAETDTTGESVTVTDSVSQSRGTNRSRTVGENDLITVTESSSDTVGSNQTTSQTESTAKTIGELELDFVDAQQRGHRRLYRERVRAERATTTPPRGAEAIAAAAPGRAAARIRERPA